MKKLFLTVLIFALLGSGFAAAQSVNPLESPVSRVAQGWKDVDINTPPDPNDKWPRGSRYDTDLGVRVLPEPLSQTILDQAHNRDSVSKTPGRYLVTEEMYPLEVSPDDLIPQKDKSTPRTGSPALQPNLNKKIYLPAVRQIGGNLPLLVIAYTSVTTNSSSIPAMTLEWIKTIQTGSTWGNRSLPSLMPEVYGGSIRVWNKVTPFKNYAGNPRYMDYNQIWAENGVCNLISTGAIRGVVVWNAGEVKNNRENAYVDGTSGGFFFDGIPACPNEAYYPYSAYFLTYVACINDDPQDGACYKPTAPVAYWIPQDVAQAVHSFTHWLEERFIRLPTTRCDFYTINGPSPSSFTDTPVTNASVNCALRVNGYIGTYRYFLNNQTYLRASAVCGDVHFAPNAAMSRASGVSNGIYNLTDTVPSQCWGWQIAPAVSTIVNVNCATWGCNPIGYYRWWMRGIPGAGNNHRDQFGFVGRNWWTDAFLVQLPQRGTGF